MQPQHGRPWSGARFHRLENVQKQRRAAHLAITQAANAAQMRAIRRDRVVDLAHAFSGRRTCQPPAHRLVDSVGAVVIDMFCQQLGCLENPQSRAASSASSERSSARNQRASPRARSGSLVRRWRASSCKRASRYSRTSRNSQSRASIAGSCASTSASSGIWLDRRSVRFPPMKERIHHATLRVPKGEPDARIGDAASRDPRQFGVTQAVPFPNELRPWQWCEAQHPLRRERGAVAG